MLLCQLCARHACRAYPAAVPLPLAAPFDCDSDCCEPGAVLKGCGSSADSTATAAGNADQNGGVTNTQQTVKLDRNYWPSGGGLPCANSTLQRRQLQVPTARPNAL